MQSAMFWFNKERNLPDSNQPWKKHILDRLCYIVSKLIPENGEQESLIPGFYMARRDQGSPSIHCLATPKMGLIIQGKKLIRLGQREYLVKPGQSIITCVDTPSVSSMLDISAAHPFLTIFFTLDRKIFLELLSEFPTTETMEASSSPPYVIDTPVNFLETLLRLTELLPKPEEARFLGPLILRELHFLLLIGPYGTFLRELYMHGSCDNRMSEVITWFKSHINESVPIDVLARMVNMSVSSLHRHFKSLTGFSPLQYQKRLKLYEAQRLMLVENERADIAAMTVGYESVTQFNREYKRMFGEPPKRDIKRRKGYFTSS